MNNASKEICLVVRTSTDVKELIKKAAKLSGTTLSQFIVEAATNKAQLVIEATKNIHLSLAEANNIFEALDKPIETNKALSDAVARFKQNGSVYLAGNKNNY